MNSFIDYLDQFNVMSPNHSKIYDEYATDKNGGLFEFNIETKIDSYLKDLFGKNPRSIILTGNAGDGKTRICRQMYNHFSNNNLEYWHHYGIEDVTFEHGTIRIVKDLSELKDEIIFRELKRLQELIKSGHAENMYYLIAANEGKLTKFLSKQPELSLLYSMVKDGFKNHNHNNEHLSIINLLDVTSSIYVEKVLDKWNNDKNWAPCHSCAKKDSCIIYFNHCHTKVSYTKNCLVEQYRMLDYLGTHITIREMLIHISYLLTGGYTCKDIQDSDYEKLQEQIEKTYYQNFYGHGIEQKAFSEMRALRLFRELDPGNYSISNIDDFLFNGDISGDEELESYHEQLFSDSLDLYFGYFKKRLESYRLYNKESNDTLIEEWVSKLRRKFYFEYPSDKNFNRKALIPFQFLNEYEQIINEDINLYSVKKDILNGLNRAFSKKLISAERSPSLFATSEDLLVHSSFKLRDIEIIIEKGRNDIDHLPAKFIVIIEGQELKMNLYVYEYLRRLGVGGTNNILKEDVEILIDTFKNELIKISEHDEDVLTILRLDREKGLYVEDSIEIDV